LLSFHIQERITMAKRIPMFGVYFLIGLVAIGLWCNAGVAGPKTLRSMPPTSPPPFTPQGVDTSFNNWISYDDGAALYYFPLPDEWGDHYFNVRFSNPDSCRLLRAALLFRRMPGDSTSISRDMHIVVFKGTSGGLLPPYASPDSAALDSVLVSGNSVLVYPETTYVDLSDLDLHFSANERFHIAWEPDYADTDSTDGVRALLADNGIPPSFSSCEWWGTSGGDTVNAWGTMFEDWDLGVDFMLRVEVEDYGPPPSSTPRWLEPGEPAAFALYGASPNPFNPSTIVRYSLPRASIMELTVWDTAGRQVATLDQGWRSSGYHEATFSGSDLPSGIYLYRLVSGQNVAAGKMVLLK
jgi:hypothetical protein